METNSQLDIVSILRSKRISLFTLSDLARILKTKHRQTLYKQIQRLVARQLIYRLTNGAYRFSFLPVDDFTTANFLCRPSYVSLESALSLHGIITGFPYQITSITTSKPRTYTVDGKEFAYSHISPRFFWGYEKKNQYLLAEKEKALLDYLYFYAKGLRSPIWDELDTVHVDKAKLQIYAKRFPSHAIRKVLKEIL